MTYPSLQVFARPQLAYSWTTLRRRPTHHVIPSVMNVLFSARTGADSSKGYKSRVCACATRTAASVFLAHAVRAVTATKIGGIVTPLENELTAMSYKRVGMLILQHNACICAQRAGAAMRESLRRNRPRRLRAVLTVAPVLFAHAAVTVAKNKQFQHP